MSTKPVPNRSVHSAAVVSVVLIAGSRDSDGGVGPPAHPLIPAWNGSFCGSTVVHAKGNQISYECLAHTHYCVCAAPIDLDGSVGFRNRAASEDHIVDIAG